MNYTKRFKLLFVGLLFIDFVHASERKLFGKPSILAGTLNYLEELGKLMTRQEEEEGLNEQEKLLNFCKEQCACPDGMNSELFKISVATVLKGFVERLSIKAIIEMYNIDRYAQDETKSGRMLAEDISKKALMLMREPWPVIETHPKLLPLSRTVPVAFQETVNQMSQGFQVIPSFLQEIVAAQMLLGADGNFVFIKELAIAACSIIDRMPKSYQKTMMKMPDAVFHTMCTIYNQLLDDMVKTLEIQGKIGDSTWCLEYLDPYCAAVQSCAVQGFFDYFGELIKDRAKEQLRNFDNGQTYRTFDEGKNNCYKKVLELYHKERFKGLLIEEKRQQELIKNAKIDSDATIANEHAKFESLCANKGCLLKSKVNPLIFSITDLYKKTGKNFEQELDEMQFFAKNDRLRIDWEVQDFKQRTLLLEEVEKNYTSLLKAMKDDQDRVRILDINGEWKESALKIVQERTEFIKDAREIKNQEYDRKVLINVAENFCKNAQNAVLLDPYFKRLKNTEQRERLAILRGIKVEKNNRLQRKNNLAVLVPYWEKLQYIAGQFKEKKITLQRFQNRLQDLQTTENIEYENIKQNFNVQRLKIEQKEQRLLQQRQQLQKGIQELRAGTQEEERRTYENIMQRFRTEAPRRHDPYMNCFGPGMDRNPRTGLLE